MTANAATAASPKPQVWEQLLELAAREVFELMLGSPVHAESGAIVASKDVTSMVGLAGTMSGVLSVHSNDRGATLMTARMLRVAPENVSGHKTDALGEICNMVAGNFKMKIPGMGEGCLLSPPTVITGSDYRLHSGHRPAIQLGFMFEGQPVVITLQLNS